MMADTSRASKGEGPMDDQPSIEQAESPEPSRSLSTGTESAAVALDTREDGYVSTPQGLFTERGVWFQVTEGELQSYAGDVLDRVGLDTLLRWASVWLDSPKTVALWVLPVVLWTTSVPIALVATTASYLGWALVSPSLVGEWAARGLSWLENVLVQALYYALTLSVLAASGAHTATIIALVGFAMFRWGVVSWATRPILQPLWDRLYSLPVADQVLRAFTIRAAVNRKLSLSHVDDMTREIIDQWGD